MGPIRTVLDNIASAKPPPPSRVNRARRISWALDAVVLKALAKRRADRYATAGDLARDLENVPGARSVSAAGGSWRSRVMKPALALIVLGVGAFATRDDQSGIAPQPLPLSTPSLAVQPAPTSELPACLIRSILREQDGFSREEWGRYVDVRMHHCGGPEQSGSQQRRGYCGSVDRTGPGA
jgi:hypothetical protein